MSASTSAVARPLKILVPLIKDELEAGDAAGERHYRLAGEMLLEARPQLSQTEFWEWGERTFNRKPTQLKRYMGLVTGPSRTLTQPNVPKWYGGVRQIAGRVNLRVLAQDKQDRDEEKRIMQRLAVQLVDIGYKVLAAKLHPDKPGGSADAMRRLNEVRRILKEAI